MKEPTTKKTQKTSGAKTSTTHGKKPKLSTTASAKTKLDPDSLYLELLLEERRNVLVSRDVVLSVGREGLFYGSGGILLGFIGGLIWDIVWRIVPSVWENVGWLQTFSYIVGTLGGVVITFFASKIIFDKFSVRLDQLEQIYNQHEEELRKECSKIMKKGENKDASI